MYKEVLQAIPDIETYPIIALAVFFSFFIGLMVWYFRVDKNKMNTMAAMPLDDETQAPSQQHFTTNS